MGDDLYIRFTIAHERSQFFIKMMASTGCIHYNDFGFLISEVKESMRHSFRQIGKIPLIAPRRE